MIDIAENKCDFCGACISVCPPNCIDVREASIMIHDDICIDCDLCVMICPIEGLDQANEK